MFSEIIDTLRCLQPHEESWLVAAAHRSEGRHIVEGVLGCPVCRARYPIVEGVADFTGGAVLPATGGAGAGAGAGDDEDAVKLAAMLDLADPRGYVLLVGEWSPLAMALREVAPVSILAVNAPASLERVDGLSALRTVERVPVAGGSARGVAIGVGSAALAESAVAAVRPGGRVVGDAALPVPDGVEEIARDDRHWVGTRQGSAGPLLQLVRTPG